MSMVKDEHVGEIKCDKDDNSSAGSVMACVSTRRVLEAIYENEFFKNKVEVTSKEYSKAATHLAGLAQQDTSGSRAAAQVLLSLYNGYNYHMGLTDLCVLDYVYLQSAIIAIRGRTTVHREPHYMIENGRDIFLALETKWKHLHVKQRYL